MNLFIFFKKQFIAIIFFAFLIEITLQILFFFEIKFIKQPFLFYNGFCHQKYWDLNPKTLKFDEEISYHPILAYKKKLVDIPNKFKKDIKKEEKNFDSSRITLYGSSFINHKDFKKIINKDVSKNFNNYALNSYGLDQIYLSYMLTSHLNQNQIIVFGFLLEDLDRSIFERRDYNKPKFSLINNNFKLTNIPIGQDKIKKKNYDFYLFSFLKNFFELIKYDYDSRLSKCDIDLKKNLFNYFFTNIQLEAEKYNQKIIVITFNLKEDITKKVSWRHNFVKKYLEENNIVHIDALKIMKEFSAKNNENVETYFAKDLHNSEKSFKYIINSFQNTYNAM